MVAFSVINADKAPARPWSTGRLKQRMAVCADLVPDVADARSSDGRPSGPDGEAKAEDDDR